MNEFAQNRLPLTSRDVMPQLYRAASGLMYPEPLPPDDTAHVSLVLDNTNCILYHANVDKLGPEEFALIRRHGFGGSDSSVLMGVNPYTTWEELIQQKASTTLSQEELETSNQIAVIKGNDLEPLIIDKFEQVFDMKTLKPTDMYSIKDFDYLKMNFDGVTGTPEQYIPVEIKVVTAKGEQHYNASRAIYIERMGWLQQSENFAAHENNSIETKAAQYGIPAYYYTQLQQEMLALNAPFGYLASLWEKTWTMHVFFVHADYKLWDQLKIQGFKAWEQVEALKGRQNAAQRISEISPTNSQSQTNQY